MSTDLDDKVAELKRRISGAQERRARAQGQAAAARDRLDRAERALREEFGVEPAKAGELIASHEADLAAEVQRVTTALERAEASE
jgi:hypothetical protein